MEKTNTIEFSLKAVFISIVLTIILAAANAYLGLKVGLTVSASIPAAVMAMGVLRFFKQRSLLETNIIQTAASAGEALTAGIIFTLPALLIVHYWFGFYYWQTFFIALLGGYLGILFSVPLRQVLLEDDKLSFPEGVAIGNVLLASEAQEQNVKELFLGGILGAVLNFMQVGTRLLSDGFRLWWHKGSLLFVFGFGFNPALIGAGFIIGSEVCLSIFIGILIGWLIALPSLAALYYMPATIPYDQLSDLIWSQQIRFIGIGILLVGALWAVCVLFKPICRGLALSWQLIHQKETRALPASQKDLPIHYVLLCLVVLLVIFLGSFWQLISTPYLSLSVTKQVVLLGLAGLYCLLGGFVFASVCGYFAGLVGSSSNPLSSISLICLMISAALIYLVLGQDKLGDLESAASITASGVVIIIAALLSASAAICNDTVQDLKAGEIVGATPWKQQLAMFLGVTISAIVIPPILNLLFNAYGIAGILPRVGMDPSDMLTAPQAGLMATVVSAIFSHQQNWHMLALGMSVGVAVIILDKITSRRGLRLHLLAVGLGVYLPVFTTMALCFGGGLSWLVRRALASESASNEKSKLQRALLLACGLVAGAAVMGVLLAIPVALSGSAEALSLLPQGWQPLANAMSAIITLWVAYWFIQRVKR